jgi:hypothetical protein
MTESLDSFTVKSAGDRPLQINNVHTLVEYNGSFATLIHHSENNLVIDVISTLENLSAVSKLSGSRVCPLLIDFTGFQSIIPLYTPTARTVLLGNDAYRVRTAVAFLFSKQSQIDNAFLFRNSNKFNIPLKMFSNQEEAILWLSTFILN